LYRDFCDYLVIDRQDAGLAPKVAAEGPKPVVANTIMESLEDKIRLAKEILELLP
jgi:hypothetical protein